MSVCWRGSGSSRGRGEFKWQADQRMSESSPVGRGGVIGSGGVMTAGTSACAAPGRLPLLLVCHTHGMPRRWHLRARRQTHWSSDLRHNRSMIACTGQVCEPLTFPHGDRPQKFAASCRPCSSSCSVSTHPPCSLAPAVRLTESEESWMQDDHRGGANTSKGA